MLENASGLPIIFAGELPVAAPAGQVRLVQLACKRGIDLVFASIALLVLAPLLVLLGIAIRLTSKGPALFRQDREGRNGQIISIYKLRSMAVGPTGYRVTPIGRWIRRTSIDELPQLFNVLRGDMSLVGPRPHPIGLLAAGVPYGDLVPYYEARHVMRPGLTGWAQANGLRGPTDDARAAQARIEHDIAYIQNFSLLLDGRIIVRTLLREFLSGSGT